MRMDIHLIRIMCRKVSRSQMMVHLIFAGVAKYYQIVAWECSVQEIYCLLPDILLLMFRPHYVVSLLPIASAIITCIGNLYYF